ncbi:MAG TPA: nicotinate phosphoribosyltransferase [Usitatibacter sp.]|nr:nicotinate phosphoribosyltransferase [Usitatibacter sp.]
MAEEPIIRSLLDTDLYKFTMWQVFLHRFPAATGEYRFQNRAAAAMPLAGLREEVEAQIDHLCTLRFTPEELAYLRGLRFIKSDFADYLELFQFRRRFIRVGIGAPGELEIVARGPLMHVMFFEIFVLAIVSELHSRRFDPAAARAGGRARLAAKVERLREFAREPPRRNPYLFFEFGTRRRASREWHDEVVATLKREVPGFFRGTSNVDMARRHGVVPIGTMAHEYLQAFQGFGYRLRDFQKMALENWVAEYRGDLGIALTDVVSMDAFLADFDLYFAKLFDGLRQDSGDPFVWGEKALAHYAKLRVDPQTKLLTFSDALDFGKTFALYRAFADRARVAFGIGTHLTNDRGHEHPNIVMKLTECNGFPVAKISDAPGKASSVDPTFLRYLRQVFGLPPEG